MTTRKKTESVGKLAIGIKDKNIAFENLGYIMFHYWKNEDATPYRIVNSPRIVSKQDIPDGYLLRMTTDAQKFLLLEYNPNKPAIIGEFDIMKVQRKGKGRYLPFVTNIKQIALTESEQ